MKVTETREEMLKIIRAVEIGGKTYEEYVNELCDRLMEAGAFVPPVKCGETVFAACPALTKLDEDIIDEYKVRGYGVNEEGEIFVLDACKEINIACDMYANLTREEAEMWLKKEKKR
jgi:hypothetical protein